MLVAGFEQSRLIRSFPNGWSEALVQFRPSALAGSFEAVIPLTIRSHELDLRHAVIIFHNDLKVRLRESERDLLWKSFGVPVFEQVLDPQNGLLAMECEAHEGLHLMSDRPDVALDHSPCPCGNHHPRLIVPRPLLRMAALVS